MSEIPSAFQNECLNYLGKIQSCFTTERIDLIERLSQDLLEAWVERRQVFICGNGGSAANALHMANDLHYGAGACGSAPKLPGIKVEALPANTGIITCLARHRL